MVTEDAERGRHGARWEQDATALLAEADGFRAFRWRRPIVVLVVLGAVLGVAVMFATILDDPALQARATAPLGVLVMGAILILTTLVVFGIALSIGEPAFLVRVLAQHRVPAKRRREVVAATGTTGSLRRAVRLAVGPNPPVPDAVHRPAPARDGEVHYRERRWLAETGLSLWFTVALGFGLLVVVLWFSTDPFLRDVRELWPPIAVGVALGVLATIAPVGQTGSSIVVRDTAVGVWFAPPRRIPIARIVAFGQVDVEEVQAHVHESQWRTYRTSRTWRPWVAVWGGWYSLTRAAIVLNLAAHPPGGLVWITEAREDDPPRGWLLATRDPDALLAALRAAGAQGDVQDVPLSWDLPPEADRPGPTTTEDDPS
ncbi:MAG: hypothetical protein JJT89_01970 [Nitriliruptoraceae bacterium]|nr:hypothetical protein [Nitriliruptoraceae bacterium]